ncbi:MAG TPA: SGNH/GDSL hydrolase family protein [Armatimonadota bacterium]|nr:SGNH/GDSL hydrolase family protein [Armatimonadota bacterium]
MSLSSLQTLHERAKSAQPILWNFLGDSITHGALHTWGRRDYVELFEERVRWQLQRADDVIIKTAYSGSSVPVTLETLGQRCIRFQPDIVSIMLGVNDASLGMENLPAFAEGYLTLIRRIHKETPALIFIQTPNRLDIPNSAMRGQCIEAYVEEVRRIAELADVPCCDHYAVWQAYETHTQNGSHYLRNDPLHPNNFGHLLLANTLLEWIGLGQLQHMTPISDFNIPTAEISPLSTTL